MGTHKQIDIILITTYIIKKYELVYTCRSKRFLVISLFFDKKKKNKNKLNTGKKKTFEKLKRL